MPSAWQSSSLLPHGAIIGLDILLLARMQSSNIEPCLSASFAKELTQLVSRIELSEFTVNDTATRAYQALRVDMRPNTYYGLDDL